VAVGSGQVRYTPAPTFQGNDSFTYTVADALGLSATGEVAVFVYAGSVPPPNQLVITPEGSTVRLHRHVGAGEVCEWQRSRDLVQWTIVSSAPAPPHGIAELVEPVPVGGNACYRAVRK
jgi:hypothetical protein